MATVTVDITNNVVTTTTTPANLVTVASGGPQGPPGPTGSIGNYTGSAYISGSLIITGSIEVDGTFTASYFGGDGSELTNVTASYVELNNVVGSASLSTRLEDLEQFSSSLDVNFVTEAELALATSSLSSSLAIDISTNSSSIYNLVIDSGSFSTRVTDLEQFSSSLDATFVTKTELATATSSLSSSLAIDISSNSSSISNLVTDSSSFSLRITTNEADINNLQSDSGSFSTRIIDLEQFSSSLDATFVTEIELASATSSLSSSLATDISSNSSSISDLVIASGSFSSRLITQENFSSSVSFIYATKSLLNSASFALSSSLSVDINSNSSSISNLIVDSSSFSLRITTNETDISNLQTDSSSFSTRITTNETNINNLQIDSSSFSTRITTNETNINNLQTDSGSFSTRISTNESDINNLQTDSSSFSTRINTNSSSIAIINNTTSSYARTDQNNTFSGLQTFTSGSFNILSATSASFGYLTSVTGSVKIIGDAFIILNNDTPTERYAGVIVQDSGSNATASFFFDGQTNDWNYEYSTPGGTDYGVALFGPEYNTKGSPTYLTSNTIPKAIGSHHLNDSSISDDGSIVKIDSNTQITGSLTISSDIFGNIIGNLTGIATTASYALFSETSISSSHALSSDTAISSSHTLNANNAISSSFSATSSLSLSGDGVFSGSFSGSFQGDGSNLTGTLYEELVSGSTSYTITHNLNQRFPIVQVYDSASASQVIPQTIQSTGLNSLDIIFHVPFEGYVIVKK